METSTVLPTELARSTIEGDGISRSLSETQMGNDIFFFFFFCKHIFFPEHNGSAN